MNRSWSVVGARHQPARQAQTIFQELGDQSGALALKCQLESEPGSQWFQGSDRFGWTGLRFSFLES